MDKRKNGHIKGKNPDDVSDFFICVDGVGDVGIRWGRGSTVDLLCTSAVNFCRGVFSLKGLTKRLFHLDSKVTAAFNASSVYGGERGKDKVDGA